nr:protein E6-like [Ipomoea batatas]
MRNAEDIMALVYLTLVLNGVFFWGYEPSFAPENETGGYGLYGHESGQLPPSATAVNNHAEEEEVPYKKYLPKNYNPVAYVTVPEDNNNDDDAKFMAATAADNRGFYNGDKEFAAAGESRMPEDTRFMDKEFTTSGDNRRDFYNGAGESRMPGGDTRFMENEFSPSGAGADNRRDFYNGAGESRMPQNTRFMDKEFTTYGTADNRRDFYNGAGESRMPDDTRFTENEFTSSATDNRQKYARHPYENSRNHFNNNNGFKNNFMENNYQNMEEFQDQEDIP